MNEEELQKQLAEHFTNKTAEDTQYEGVNKNLSMLKDWDDYYEEHEWVAGQGTELEDVDYDFETSIEADRLGADYEIGSRYNQEALARRQSTSEQVGRALNKTFWNTMYDTVGGTASMLDFKNYIGYEKDTGSYMNQLSQYMRDLKKEQQKQDKIYLSKDAGIGSSAWWLENGSGLVSSMASFGLQGAGIGKALQGVKYLTSLGKLGKASKAARRGEDLVTGTIGKGEGLTGAGITNLNKAKEFAGTALTSTMLNQSAAVMSAADVYDDTYNKALSSGYGVDYAKKVASEAASNTINISRANIILNMTMANKFLKKPTNIAKTKKPTRLDKLKEAGKESLQEVAEENIEMIAEKQGRALGDKYLKDGRDADKFRNNIGPINIDGNVYGDASTKEILETSLLGAIGGPMQMATIDGVGGNLGSSEGRVGSALNKVTGGGYSRLFGSKKERRYDENVYYEDGNLKFNKGDIMYEMEPDTYTDDEGNTVEKKNLEGETIMKPKLDDKGKPIALYEQGSQGDDKYFSKNELQDFYWDKQDQTRATLEEIVKKQNAIVATAKYQAGLEKTIADINTLVDKGAANLSKEEKDIMADNMTKLDMINEGTVDLEADNEAYQARLDKNKKEIESLSGKDLRKKQDEYAKFSLARAAVESFQQGNKDVFTTMLEEMKALTPEQAIAAGYDPDTYKQKIDEAVTLVDSYYNKWLEYNTKHDPNIATALFNNRISYDSAVNDINDLDSDLETLADSLTDKDIVNKDGKPTDINEDGSSVKDNYKEAFKLEQQKQRKYLKDKKLQELEGEKNTLEKELNDTFLTYPSNEKESNAKIKKLEDLQKRVDKNSKDIDSRRKELGKNEDAKIKKLVSDLNMQEYSDLYNKKIQLVEKLSALNKKYDGLISEDSKDNYYKLQQQRQIDILKNRLYRSAIKNLFESQEKGDTVYFNGIPGKISQDGTFTVSNKDSNGEDIVLYLTDEQLKSDKFKETFKPNDLTDDSSYFKYTGEGRIELFNDLVKSLSSIDNLQEIIINADGVEVSLKDHIDAINSKIKEDNPDYKEIKRLISNLSGNLNNDLSNRVSKLEEDLQKERLDAADDYTGVVDLERKIKSLNEFIKSDYNSNYVNAIKSLESSIYNTERIGTDISKATVKDGVSFRLNYQSLSDNAVYSLSEDEAKVQEAYEKVFSIRNYRNFTASSKRSDLLDKTIKVQDRINNGEDLIESNLRNITNLEEVLKMIGFKNLDENLKINISNIVALLSSDSETLLKERTDNLKQLIDKVYNTIDENLEKLDVYDKAIQDKLVKVEELQSRTTSENEESIREEVELLTEIINSLIKEREVVRSNIAVYEQELSKYQDILDSLNTYSQDPVFLDDFLNSLKSDILGIKNTISSASEIIGELQVVESEYNKRIAVLKKNRKVLFDLITGSKYINQLEEDYTNSLMNLYAIVDEADYKKGLISKENRDRIRFLFDYIFEEKANDIDFGQISKVLDSMSIRKDIKNKLQAEINNMVDIRFNMNETVNKLGYKSTMDPAQFEQQYNDVMNELIQIEAEREAVIEQADKLKNQIKEKSEEGRKLYETYGNYTTVFLSLMDPNATFDSSKTIPGLNDYIINLNNNIGFLRDEQSKYEQLKSEIEAEKAQLDEQNKIIKSALKALNKSSDTALAVIALDKDNKKLSNEEKLELLNSVLQETSEYSSKIEDKISVLVSELELLNADSAKLSILANLESEILNVIDGNYDLNSDPVIDQATISRLRRVIQNYKQKWVINKNDSEEVKEFKKSIIQGMYDMFTTVDAKKTRLFFEELDVISAITNNTEDFDLRDYDNLTAKVYQDLINTYKSFEKKNSNLRKNPFKFPPLEEVIGSSEGSLKDNSALMNMVSKLKAHVHNVSNKTPIILSKSYSEKLQVITNAINTRMQEISTLKKMDEIISDTFSETELINLDKTRQQVVDLINKYNGYRVGNFNKQVSKTKETVTDNNKDLKEEGEGLNLGLINSAGNKAAAQQSGEGPANPEPEEGSETTNEVDDLNKQISSTLTGDNPESDAKENIRSTKARHLEWDRETGQRKYSPNGLPIVTKEPYDLTFGTTLNKIFDNEGEKNGYQVRFVNLNDSDLDPDNLELVQRNGKSEKAVNLDPDKNGIYVVLVDKENPNLRVYVNENGDRKLFNSLSEARNEGYDLLFTFMNDYRQDQTVIGNNTLNYWLQDNNTGFDSLKDLVEYFKGDPEVVATINDRELTLDNYREVLEELIKEESDNNRQNIRELLDEGEVVVADLTAISAGNEITVRSGSENSLTSFIEGSPKFDFDKSTGVLTLNNEGRSVRVIPNKITGSDLVKAKAEVLHSILKLINEDSKTSFKDYIKVVDQDGVESDMKITDILANLYVSTYTNDKSPYYFKIDYIKNEDGTSDFVVKFNYKDNDQIINAQYSLRNNEDINNILPELENHIRGSIEPVNLSDIKQGIETPYSKPQFVNEDGQIVINSTTLKENILEDTKTDSLTNEQLESIGLDSGILGRYIEFGPVTSFEEESASEGQNNNDGDEEVTLEDILNQTDKEFTDFVSELFGGMPSANIEVDPTIGINGSYNKNTNTIVLKNIQNTPVLLHELMHKKHYDMLESDSNNEMYNAYSKFRNVLLRKMKGMNLTDFFNNTKTVNGKEVNNIFYFLFGKEASTQSNIKWITAIKKGNVEEMLENLSDESLHELFPSLMNEKSFVKFLNSIELTAEDRKELGIEDGPKNMTLYQAFLKIISKIFELGNTDINNTMLEAAIRVGTMDITKSTETDENVDEESETEGPSEFSLDFINNAGSKAEEEQNNLEKQYTSNVTKNDNLGNDLLDSMDNFDLDDIVDESPIDNTMDNMNLTQESLDSDSILEVIYNNDEDLFNNLIDNEDIYGIYEDYITGRFTERPDSISESDWTKVSGIFDNIKNYLTNLNTSNVDTKSTILSSTYDFNGVKLNQKTLNNLMDGLTSEFFNIINSENNTELFFTDQLNEQETYSQLRGILKNKLSNIVKYYDEYFNDFRSMNGKFKPGDYTGIEDDPVKVLAHNMVSSTLAVFKRKASKSKTSAEKLSILTDAYNNNSRIVSIKNLLSNFLGDDNASKNRFADVAKFHTAELKNYSFKVSEDSIDQDKFNNELESGRDPIFSKDSTQIDPKSGIPVATKLLLSSQPVYQKKTINGKTVMVPVVNELGLTVPNDFSRFYNLVVKRLAGLPPEKRVMMNKLLKVYQSELRANPNSVELHDLVTTTESPLMLLENKSIDEITTDDLRMVNQFIQTFSKATPKFILSTITNDGTVQMYDGNKNKTVGAIMNDWRNEFDRLYPNGITLGKLREIVVKKGQNFLNPLGIYIDSYAEVNKEHKLNANETGSLTVTLDIVDQIKSALIKSIKKDYKGKKDDLLITDVLRMPELNQDLTKVARTVSNFNQVIDNQLMSVDNKRLYGITLNNMLSLFTHRYNQDSGNKTSLEQNSPWLNTAWNNTSIMKNSIGLGNEIEVGILNGITVQGDSRGSTTKDLGKADKWYQMISSTMNGYYTFFRAADRGTENYFALRSKAGSIVKLHNHDRKKLLESYLDYLKDEVTSIYNLKNEGLGSNIKFYNGKGHMFRFFTSEKVGGDIMNQLNNALNNDVTTGDDLGPVQAPNSLESILEFIDKNKNTIVSNLKNYFVNKSTSNKGIINTEGLLLLHDKPDYRTGKYFVGIPADLLLDYYNPKDLRKKVSEYKNTLRGQGLKSAERNKASKKFIQDEMEKVVSNLMYDFTLISETAYIEQTKMFTGDPYMYKNQDDFFKRMSMLNSTKKVSVEDSRQDEILNARNTFKVFYEGSDININLDKEVVKNLMTEIHINDNKDYQSLMENNFTQNNIDLIKERTGTTDVDFSKLELVPDIGYNPSHLIFDTATNKHNHTFTSMILNDDESVSNLALDTDENGDFIKSKDMSIVIDNGDITYGHNKDGEFIELDDNNVSVLRKLFTREFYNDGITNPVKLQSKVNSYLSNYQQMEVADGQAWATLPAYREILIKAGDWPAKSEAAYKKAILGQELDTDDTKALFRVLKTQYAGPLDVEGLFVPTGYKHSVAPLIPSMIKGTTLENLNKIMLKNGVSVTHMSSANKFGRILDDSGDINSVNIVDDIDSQVVTQNNSYEFYGVQLDQAPKMKNKITASTQHRKLILSDLLQEGVPVDFQGTESQWRSLSENEKASQSRVYNYYKEYHNLQAELFQKPFDQLVKELDITVDNKGKYNIGNREALVNVALEMANDRGVSDNIKNSIRSLIGKDSYIESTLNKDKIENVIFAIINSRVIREKRKGEGSPQLSAQYFQDLGATAEGEMGRIYSHDTLRHYEQDSEGNVMPSQCMIAIPRDMIDYVNVKYGSLDKFNEVVSDLNDKIYNKEPLNEEEQELSNIIRVIGFRIPNQGLNSSEFMIVKKFLPYEAGDTIIVAPEIVAKSGADFDIDKMNTYLASYKPPVVKDGKVVTGPKYIKYDTSENTTSERYIQYVLDSVNSQQKALGKASENIVDFLDEANKEKELAKTTAKDARSVAKKKVSDAQENLDDVKNIGKYLFFSIPSSKIIDDFLDLNKEYNNAGMSGIEKQAQFLYHTISLIDQLKELEEDFVSENIIDAGSSKEELVKSLEVLRDYYNEQLSVNAGIINFRDTLEGKEFNKKLQELNKARQEKNNLSVSFAYEDYNELMSDYKFVLAEAVAEANDMISLDEFAQLPIEKQNGVKSLQNRMIEVQFDIMSLPVNYRPIMAPVSDAVLIDTEDGAVWNVRFWIAKDQATEELRDNFLYGKRGVKNRIKKFLKEKGIKNTEFVPDDLMGEFLTYTYNGKTTIDEYVSTMSTWANKTKNDLKNKHISSIIDPAVNVNKFIEFLSGKSGVGQTAVHITHHQLGMASNLQFNRPNSLWVFPHNKSTKGNPSFAFKNNQSNERISEILSGYLNAYVDIAKDPYVQDLMAIPETSNVILYMIRGGAPIKWISKFLSQPIVKDFIAYKKANRSMFMKAAGKSMTTRQILTDLAKSYQVYEYDKKTKTSNVDDLVYFDTRDFNNSVTTLFDLYSDGVEITDDNRLAATSELNDLKQNYYSRLDYHSSNVKDLQDQNLFTEQALDEYLHLGKEYFTNADNNSSKDDKYRKAQLNILDLFLEYQEQSNDMQMLVRSTSVDAKGAGKNLNDNKAFLREGNLITFKDTFNESAIDYIFNNTIVNSPQKSLETAVNAYKTLYFSEQNPIVNAHKNALTKIIVDANAVSKKSKNIDKEGKSDLQKTYDNDLVVALLTSNVGLSALNTRKVFEQLFIKSDSNYYINNKGEKAPLGEIIYELTQLKSRKRGTLTKKQLLAQARKTGVKPTALVLYSLRNEEVFNNLLGRIPKQQYSSYDDFINKNVVDNSKEGKSLYSIENSSNKLDSSKENKIRNSFIVIKEFANAQMEGSPESKIYNDLFRFAIHQSGVQHNSPITWTKLLPNEDVEVLTKSAISTFESLSNLEKQVFLEKFQEQFLARNTRYVPVMDTKTVTDPFSQTGVSVELSNKFNSKDSRSNFPILYNISYKKGTFIKTAYYKTKAGINKDGSIKYVYKKGISSSVPGIVGKDRFFMGYDININDVNHNTKNTGKNEETQTYTTLPISKKFTRSSVTADTEYLYLFTDNAGRTSGKGKIDPNSTYAKEFGTGSRYPSMTQAVIRGLDNSAPITTMVDDKRTQWTEDRFDEFKDIIDKEFEYIETKMKSGNYKGIKFSDQKPFGQGTYSKLPDNLQRYLDSKLLEIGIVNDSGVSNKVQQQSSQLQPSTSSFTYKGKTIPTEFELSKDQSNALKDLIDWYTSRGTDPIVLQGPAGTGKTSVIGYFQKYIGSTVLYTAPTHAATLQLTFAAFKTGSKKLASTIRSSVYRKKQKGKKDRAVLTIKASKKLGFGNTIVVDESSMVGPEEQWLLEDLSKQGYKIIYVGDKMQIPYVNPNNPRSKSLTEVFTKYENVNLEKIHRTKDPVLTTVLNKIRNSNVDQLYKTNDSETATFYGTNELAFNQEYVRNLKKNPEEVIFIAYNNGKVQEVNQSSREVLGRGISPEVGDIITGYLSYASKQIEKGHLANSVIYTITDINAKEDDSSAKEIQFTSKKLEELKKKGVQGIPEASDFKTTYYQLSRDDSFNFEDLNRNDFDKNNRTVSSLFRKLHNNYKSLLPLKGRNYTAWLETLEEFKNIISKLDLGNTYIYNPSSNKMEKFSKNKHRNLKFQFPHLFIEKGADYGHAITAHKSQGSTYDNVFVDANSFNSIPRTNIMEDGKQINTEKQAIAYVALSRNSKKLHVYEGKTNFKNVKVDDNVVNNSSQKYSEKVIPGVHVIRNGLSENTQLELFEMLKKPLEEQGAVSNKGKNANVMIGLGLRWDYRSNNPKQKPIDLGNIIDNKSKSKYGYYEKSAKGQSLYNIPNELKSVLTKMTGVDASNYDGAIINLYTDNTFISTHNDVDESAEAINYPVLVANIGGSGNFSVERVGKDKVGLKSGDGYIFGLNGKNRKVFHRTFPSKQDGFLPEITINGITYPEGSYRISITLRRVKPLNGIPNKPRIRKEYNFNPTSVSEKRRNEFKKFVLDELGNPLSIEFESKNGDSFYKFTFKDGTYIETPAKGRMLSYPNAPSNKIAELSKKYGDYDIKLLVGLNKLAEEKLKKQPTKLAPKPENNVTVEYKGNNYSVDFSKGVITNLKTNKVLKGGVTSPAGDAIFNLALAQQEAQPLYNQDDINDNTTNTPDLSPLDVSSDMTKSKLQAQQDLDNAINDPCNK